MKNKRGSTLIWILIIAFILMIILVTGIVVYIMFSKEKLAPYTCKYDSKKYITCGTAFVLINEGKEYSLKVNKPLYFPYSGLIGLFDPSKHKNESAYFIYLNKEGIYNINEETSRKAIGSFIVE